MGYTIKECNEVMFSEGNRELEEIKKIAPVANKFWNDFLLDFINENKDTEFGKAHNFENIHSYEDYVKNVPLTGYSDYAEYIDRMAENGEQNLLTKDPVVCFTMTTGTTSKRKLIPMTKKAKETSVLYTSVVCGTVTNNWLSENGKGGIYPDKLICLVEMGEPSYSKSNLPIGGISSTVSRDTDEINDLYYTAPKEVISPSGGYQDSKYLNLLFGLKYRNVVSIVGAYMTTVAGFMDIMESRWEDLCDDIEKGTIHEDVEMPPEIREKLLKKLSPDPVRAEELRNIFKGGFDEPVLPKIWPHLCYIHGIGSGCFKIHADKVRRFAGNDIPFNNIAVAASESLIAFSLNCNAEDFALVPKAGFFEFIPDGENDCGNILTADKLKVGEKYEVVLTTLNGFYRYRIGDVLEVVGFMGEIPIVHFSHRNNVFIDVAGEKSTEADLFRAVTLFSEKTGITVNEFCAYADHTENMLGHYCILIEPDGVMDTEKLDEYSEIMDECLCNNFGYKYEKLDQNIGPARVFIQQHQTHLLYRELMIMKGAPRNQLKPVRVLNKPELLSFFTGMTEK